MTCPHPHKRAYGDATAAKKALTALIRDTGAQHVGVYQCRCGKWHVGHSGKLWRNAIGRALRAGNQASRAQRRARTR